MAGNFVFLIVNAMTAGGTVNQALVALLRWAGFRTGLMRLAHQPDRIAADHVFSQYYSEEKGQWVTLDPQLGFLRRDRTEQAGALGLRGDVG